MFWKKQSLYDQTKRKIDEGIAVSYANADSVWLDAVHERVREIIHDMETFTADDIIIPVTERGYVTGNNSALGAVIRGLKQAGIIKANGDFRRSKRPLSHGKILPVWRVVK